MFFFTSKTDIWVQIGRGKVGLSGNIQVKSYILKSKFDNVIDIRKEYCLYIQNMRKTLKVMSRAITCIIHTRNKLNFLSFLHPQSLINIWSL